MEQKHDISEGERAAAQIVSNNLIRLMRMSDTLNTIKALSEAAGLSRATVSRVIKMETGVTLAVLEPLSNALAVEAWMLLYPNFNPLKPPIFGQEVEHKEVLPTDAAWLFSEEATKWVDKKPRVD